MTIESQPKVFISYSWSSIEHQTFVKECADRLISDGVAVVLDIYDLREGDDKYAFMESMVTDKSVTHVLIMCDKRYAEKADARAAGVGTESQIISKHVYEKVAQSKFIPIICEKDENSAPITPTFLQSRISIDFSNPEKYNENWETLIRLLFGKPLHVKPALGKRPSYIEEDTAIPTSNISSKFNTLKQAILQEKKRISPYRRDFLNACIEHADKFRVRNKSQITGEEILEDLRNLKPVRNYITDWIILDSETGDTNVFNESLITLLENLIELKSRPKEVTSWSSDLFEAQEVFVYETFLYIVAALLKTGAYESLREIFQAPYSLPETTRNHLKSHTYFDGFYGYSEKLQVLAPEGRRLHSPAAEYIKINADKEEINFESIKEAELLVLMMSFIKKIRWFPQTLYYSGYHTLYPFFQKSTFKRNFNKLETITGYKNPEDLKSAIISGHNEARTESWQNFHFTNFLELLNVHKIGTE